MGKNKGKILIPGNKLDDWKLLLAEPTKQWKPGYSARTLACSWLAAKGGFPKEVHAVLSKAFQNIELLLAIPEHKVPLPPPGARASQNDIWALAGCKKGLVSIAVEGKVSEPFGPTIFQWMETPTPGKKKRIKSLGDILGIGSNIPGGIRYQLLHRTASAVIEAKRYFAPHAMLLVHSFSQSDEWFDDYKNFVRLFVVVGSIDKGKVVSAAKKVGSAAEEDGVWLHFVWVRGKKKYLRK